MLNMGLLEWEWLKFYRTALFVQVTNILGKLVYILFCACISYKKYVVLTLVCSFIFLGGEVQFTCNITELLLLEQDFICGLQIGLLIPPPISD